MVLQVACHSSMEVSCRFTSGGKAFRTECTEWPIDGGKGARNVRIGHMWFDWVAQATDGAVYDSNE